MQTDFYAEHFDLEDWHWWFVGRRRILLRVIDAHLPAARGRRLLDLGCGTGSMLAHLARYGETVGVDADREAVGFCRRRGLTNVEHLTSETLPFADDAFDVVTAFDVLEHVDDDARCLAEIARVLRPRGTLVLSVPAYKFLWGPQDEIAHHKRRYTAGQIRRRAAAAGFGTRKVSYFNTLLAPCVAAVRLLRPYRPGSEELRSDFEMTSRGLGNSVLARVFASEARWVERFNLPFGISILGLFDNQKAPAAANPREARA